jgi:hypothetical protein
MSDRRTPGRVRDQRANPGENPTAVYTGSHAPAARTRTRILGFLIAVNNSAP